MRVGYCLVEPRNRSAALRLVCIAFLCGFALPSVTLAQETAETEVVQEEKEEASAKAEAKADKEEKAEKKKKDAKAAEKEAAKKAEAAQKQIAAKKEAAAKKVAAAKQQVIAQKEALAKKLAEQKKKQDETKKASAEVAAQEARIAALEKKIAQLVDMIEAKVDSDKEADSTEASESKPAKEEGEPSAEEAKQESEPEASEKEAEEKKEEPAKTESDQAQPQPSQARTGQARPGRGQGRQGQPRQAQRGNARSRSTAPTGVKAEQQWIDQLALRQIGPANMSGRIADISIDDEDPSLWYVGTAGAGLLKTTNHGVRMEHLFDGETTSSVGAVAHSPSDKNTVWVGTGEPNPRNSVSYGNGVYKSTDGGKTWEHKGLEKTFQIARILIHPENPEVVYVGAAGRLYGTSRERGVYKTTDGGENWEQVLYIDDNTGVIDMIMNPEDPETIIVAMWDRMRDGFDSWPGSVPKPDGVDGYDPVRKYGAGAGLYKTTNGGADWKKLTEGLPPGKIGRVGLDWQRKESGSIYAIIDCEEIGKGPKPFTAYLGLVGIDKAKQNGSSEAVITQIMPESPAEKAKIEVGDVLVKIDGEDVESFDDLLAVQRKKKLGQNVKLSLIRKEEPLEIEVKLTGRPGSNARVPTVYLGVTGETKDSKVVLNSISERTPAATAGLKAGDIVVTADGKPAESYEALVQLVQSKSDGYKLELAVKRGEEDLKITATLVNRPGSEPRPSNRAIMGIQGEDQPGGGAKMTVITDGGPSEKAGLKAGDIIKKVAGAETANYQALIAEIRKREPDDKMKVTVVRGEKELELEITLGDRNAGSSSRPYTYSYFGQRPNIQDMQGAEGYKYGGIYKSTDAGETWERVNSLNTRPMYFSVIRVDPNDDQRVYVMGVSQFKSTNGGKTFDTNFGRGVHADSHDLWIDPSDGRHMVIAGDGGVYTSYDYGATWDHINTAAIGQFYHAAIIPKKPYWVVGGLQDNGSWAGPAISRTGGAINEDWISIGGGDGFVCRVDPNDPDLIYYESQNGSISRRHLVTGERGSCRPPREQGVEYRFNWETPFILSSHNSKIFYSAGNYVFKSVDRGNNLKRISPEITLTKRGSATDLAESPVDSNVLYVGTDDGAVWMTKDGGVNWTDITENLNAPGPRWVSSIEASRHAAGTVYVVLDGHRSDDDNPYAYVSDDYGQTFRPIHKGLPIGSTRCLREDPINKNLLYLGTEFAFWISLDRGKNWIQCNDKMPTVSIHDVATHPSVNEIVLATHGRSLWACDVSVLRSLDSRTIAEKNMFFPPQDVVRWRSAPRRGGTSRRYVGQNPASGAGFWYWMSEDAESVAFRVKSIEGNVISELKGDPKKGLRQVRWNLTQTAGNRGGSTGRPTPGFRGRGRPVASGSYLVAMVVDGEEVSSKVVKLASDPNLPANAVADEVYELELLREEWARKLKSEQKDAGVEVYKND
ncbi:MAG: PDZ domain-containing protein [Planctomycetota bacterium]